MTCDSRADREVALVAQNTIVATDGILPVKKSGDSDSVDWRVYAFPHLCIAALIRACSGIGSAA